MILEKSWNSKGKSVLDTMVLVDMDGVYAIIRYPQYLGATLLMSASILIFQHKRYMRKVPRMNVVMGVIYASSSFSV
jgi:hypothetical protein